METTLYNAQGEAVGKIQLDPKLFGVPVKEGVVQRAVLAQAANSKVAVAHTQTRGEVRGGGKKPWRQKGTGRARAGSSRSPLWVGGGVTFGPRPDRNFSLRVNKKELRKALLMSLSSKAQDKKIIVLSDLSLPEIKTKTVATLFRKLPNAKKSTLLVQSKPDAKVYRSARNIDRVTTILANSLNVVDVLRHDYLVMPQSSLEVLQKTYVPNTANA